MKKGFLVGINYSSKPFRLQFPETDARRFGQYLQSIYPDIQLTLLLGENATRQAILDGLRNFVTSAKAGDTLFFFFSGHGTQVRDPDGDEVEGMDEAILPADAPNFRDRNSLITDDQFYEIMAQLPEGVKFRIVLDACHSGTLFDLDSIVRVLPDHPNVAVSIPATKRKRAIPLTSDVMAIGSSKDSENSYENSGGGMLTSAIILQSPRSSPLTLIESLERSLRGSQTPILSMNRLQTDPFFPL